VSVLAELLDAVAARRDRRPVLVFDLDSTLISTQRRNHAILGEFVRHVGAPAELMQVVEKLQPCDMGFNLMDDLRRRGFRHEATLSRLRGFWRARFFHGDWLRHDEPLPGAVDFVRDVHAAGASVVYLTGRDEPNMGAGTRRSLAAHGFPMGDGRVHLHLKPRASQDDLAFKREAAEAIRELGEVLAAFENEPENANFFAEAFPGARVVLLDTMCRPDPPPLLPGIVRLRDFQRGGGTGGTGSDEAAASMRQARERK
jgi:hypothetical protein